VSIFKGFTSIIVAGAFSFVPGWRPIRGKNSREVQDERSIRTAPDRIAPGRGRSIMHLERGKKQ